MTGVQSVVPRVQRHRVRARVGAADLFLNLIPRSFDISNLHREAPGMRSVGVGDHLVVGGVDAVEIAARFRIMEVESRQPRIVGDLEAYRCVVPFARVRDVGDLRTGGVVVEGCSLVGLHLAARAGRGCRALKRVLAVGHALALLVLAIERGIVANARIGGDDVSAACVVIRFAGEVVVVLAHHIAIFVFVRVFEVGGTAQQARERDKLAGRAVVAHVGHHHFAGVNHAVVAQLYARGGSGVKQVQAQRQAVGVGVHRAVDMVAGRSGGIVGCVARSGFVSSGTISLVVGADHLTVENACGRPITVETQEGHRQVNTVVGGLQHGETIDECTVRRIGGCPRGERIAAAHRHRVRGGAACGNLHLVACGIVSRTAERNVDALTGPVVRLQLKQAACNLLGQRSGVGREGALLVAQVVQRHRELPLAGSAFAQVGLGARCIGCTINGGVHVG